MPTILEIAKEYTEAGIACIPISPQTKRPILGRWQAERVPWPLLEKLYKRGNSLGVVTGKMSGLVVLDIDKKGGGLSWYYEHENDLGHHVKEVTGGGGFHLYYRYPEGEEIPSFVLAPGVELKANGTQVVTWPSPYPGGKAYTIQNGLKLTDVAHEADYPPEWIMELVRQKQRTREELAGKAELQGFSDTEQNIERVRERLSLFPPAVEGKHGDDTTFNATCIGRDFGLSPQAFWPLFKEYNKRCRPPWKEADLREKMKNGYKYAKGKLGGKTAEADFTSEPEEESVKLTEEQQDEQEKTIKGRIGYVKSNPTRNARVFLEKYEGTVLYKNDQGFFYRNGRWEPLEEQALKILIDRHILELNPRLYAGLKPGILSSAAQRVKVITSREGFTAEPDVWLDGRKGDFVALENGILDIKTRELVPHSPKWFSFTKLPFAYDPEARCPVFQDFLKSLWDDDQDIKECLQLWMGYMLLSDTSAQKFLLMIGASRAGKGVLSRVMERIIGKDNCESCSLTGLAGDFGLTSLLGKKAAFFHDAYKAQGSLGDVATERLISIVGEDPQYINIKYQSPFTAILNCKIVLVCNELPAFINNRDALSNRMLVLPFAKSFAGKEDEKLLQKLTPELPAIFNWALDGARRLIEGEQLRQPKNAMSTFQDIKRVLDPMEGFIADCLTFHPPTEPWDEAEEIELSVMRLYETYQKWCEDSGHKPRAKNKFAMALKHWADKNQPHVTQKVSWLDGRSVRVFTNVSLATYTQDFH